MGSCLRRDKRCLMFKAKTPHFFKIILDDTIRDGKLRIPRRFVKNYGDDLSSPVLLKVPSGAKWQVQLVKHDGEIWLQKGWQEFLKYYSLAHGSFLVFEYNQSNCDFNVIIFDRSATEIDYPFSIINGDNDRPNPEQTESDVSVEILSEFPPSRKTRKKSQIPFPPPNKKIKLDDSTEQVEGNRGGISRQKQALNEVMVRTQPLTAEEKANALDRATTNFKSKNPYFMIAMQPTYVHPGKLSIPASFAKKYFNKQGGTVTLKTADGKTWSVWYSYNVSSGKVSAKMSYGWKEFRQEYHLDVGDVCVFELINPAKTTLRVVIFRWIKDANSNPSIGESKLLKQEIKSIDRNFIQRNSYSKILETVEDANQYTSLNPFFKVNMQPSYLKNGRMTLRKEFLEKCAMERVKNVMLQVENRQWPVKLIFNRSSCGRGCFSAGWSSFAKENSLQVGDICIFELVNSKIELLKVSIFRNVK